MAWQVRPPGRRDRAMDFYRIWFWVSSLILAALLFRPVKKFILAQRFRKTERRIGRELRESERIEIERKTIPVTALIVITFSLLFNTVLMGRYFYR